MTVRHLKIFTEVYRAGNITKAAKQLYITQPAATRAIQELERYYGVRLFERVKRRLSVTEAGERLYAYAVHIIDSFDRMEKDLRDWDELGVLRVGASVTMGSLILPKVLKAFTAAHPAITVKATVTNGTRLQEMLENNELDLALIEGGIVNDNLTAEEFGEDRLLLILPPDSELLDREELRLEDLTAYPFLLRDKESVSRILIDHIFAGHGLTPVPLMESVSTHAIIHGVHEGLGISMLPEDLVRYSVESGFVATRPLADETFLRKDYIVYHKNKFLSASARDLTALCRAEAADGR